MDIFPTSCRQHWYRGSTWMGKEHFVVLKFGLILAYSKNQNTWNYLWIGITLLASKSSRFSHFSIGFEEIWHQVPINLFSFEKLACFNEKRFVKNFTTKSRVSVSYSRVYFILLVFLSKLILWIAKFLYWSRNCFALWLVMVETTLRSREIAFCLWRLVYFARSCKLNIIITNSPGTWVTYIGYCSGYASALIS